jgi:hypothetical protein
MGYKALMLQASNWPKLCLYFSVNPGPTSLQPFSATPTPHLTNYRPIIQPYRPFPLVADQNLTKRTNPKKYMQKILPQRLG